MRKKTNNKTNTEKTLRLPIRIEGNTTSISLRKNIIALWILLNDIKITNKNGKNGKDSLVNFTYDCLEVWEQPSAKGFSDFVTEKMISDILEREDYRKYKTILQSI